VSATVTSAQIKAIAGSGARADLVSAIVRGWPAAAAKAKLTSKVRAAHFLAQIMTETGGLRILEESGAYKSPRIMEIFGKGHHSAAITEAEARQIAALPPARRAQVLFNRVYGTGNPKKSREFNNTGPNDGWLYRGGGMMQATGKSNYAAMEKKTGLPLVAHPEMLHQPDSAFMAAYLEWAQDGRCNAAADADNVVAVRRIINGGSNGLAECRDYLAKAKKALAGYAVAPVAALVAAPDETDESDQAVLPADETATLDPVDPVDMPAPAADVLPATTNSVATNAATDPAVIGDAEIFGIKSRLRTMNYNPGVQNGQWGGMTAGAIAGFINDRGGFVSAPVSMETFNQIRDRLKEELTHAEAEVPPFKRPVTEERKNGDAKTVAAVAPEIVPAKRGFLATISAAILSFLTAIWSTISAWVSSAWDFLTDHKDDLPSSDSGYAATAMEYVQKVPVGAWALLICALFGLLAWNAWRQIKLTTTAVRTGARQ
jgi:predicted chitinase